MKRSGGHGEEGGWDGRLFFVFFFESCVERTKSKWWLKSEGAGPRGRGCYGCQSVGELDVE